MFFSHVKFAKLCFRENSCFFNNHFIDIYMSMRKDIKLNIVNVAQAIMTHTV